MAAVWIFEDPLASPLLIFITQLCITLLLTRILGKVLSYVRQPPVIGEIIAGIILGPSVLGNIPGFTNAIFPTKAFLTATTTYNSVLTFGVIANIGLILFMFLMGMELDRGLLRKQWTLTFPIALAAIVVPFSIGVANAATWLYDVNAEGQPPSWSPPSNTAFVLFIGAAMSFTAFPVLAALLSHNNLFSSPLGVLVMSTAAVDDVMAWCTLAISSSFSRSNDPIDGLYVVALSVLYAIIMVFGVRLLLNWIHGVLLRRGLHTSPYYFTGLILMLFASSYCTEVIGIHAFFGAFMAGLVIPKDKNSNFVEEMGSRMELVVKEVLLPLYFAYSGIRTDIGSLNTIRYWGITLAVICLAVVGKFGAGCLASKLLSRRSWRFCVTVGLFMNTRGLVEIIALNVGLQLGILSTRLFTIMVLMAIATTVMTNPLVYLIFLKRYPSGDDTVEPSLHSAPSTHGRATSGSLELQVLGTIGSGEVAVAVGADKSVAAEEGCCAEPSARRPSSCGQGSQPPAA
mmetsp:Transcript_8096/g.17328  ORF Transcript_8096/g.17328 Transcript_8096/m.17328 type:complete len:514 (+) Transcript_8096:192-1733(+)|eukprot:CAMPEP_0202893868 /NCGR_PEP_ID=MMETSP1392-20130828/3365_1 /ASSEMBLY_ACC=CAM_ASM_000868 /TAXON_ID=225041 /ORGANISM="Chlamydomonas chlamydogama, Strain SAG 11-48b" /LENGTH=513 /DNA_ID=CAMNT_0049578355 /DNA_START=281 /DNA_END=1822 /DNA_ORIENTATION=-